MPVPLKSKAVKGTAEIRKPLPNPQCLVLVVVLVIETSQVEHEDENDDEDDPQSGSAVSAYTLRREDSTVDPARARVPAIQGIP
jgi:hypothetical protein